MNKITLDLNNLYNKVGEQLEHTDIVPNKVDDCVYYDLFVKNGSMVCCDGEMVEIIKENGNDLLLINIDSNLEFKLTKEEYKVATEFETKELS